MNILILSLLLYFTFENFKSRCHILQVVSIFARWHPTACTDVNGPFCHPENKRTLSKMIGKTTTYLLSIMNMRRSINLSSDNSNGSTIWSALSVYLTSVLKYIAKLFHPNREETQFGFVRGVSRTVVFRSRAIISDWIPIAKCVRSLQRVHQTDRR